MPASGNNDRICVGVIGAPHGVRGLVRVKSFTETPEDVAAYGPLTDGQGRQVVLTVTGHAKGMIVCRVDGITDRDGAAAIKGERLYVARAALPPTGDGDEFYHADLIGLTVETADGEPVGSVRAVHDFGAGDVLEVISAEDSRAVVLPFTREVVPEVDIPGRRIVVAPPAGLLDEAEPELEAAR